MANNLVDVPEAWVKGEAYESGKFGTDGNVIWTYDMVVGFTDTNGKKVFIRNTKAYGHFAQNHVRAVKVNAQDVYTASGKGQHIPWHCSATNCEHMPDWVNNPKRDKAKVSRHVNRQSKQSKHYAEEVLRELEAATG